MRTPKNEKPKKMYVVITDKNGIDATLVNDGVTTAILPANKQVLQSQAAFRGFVGTMTELFGYTITKAWDEPVVNDEVEWEDL